MSSNWYIRPRRRRRRRRREDRTTNKHDDDVIAFHVHRKWEKVSGRSSCWPSFFSLSRVRTVVVCTRRCTHLPVVSLLDLMFEIHTTARIRLLIARLATITETRGLILLRRSRWSNLSMNDDRRAMLLRLLVFVISIDQTYVAAVVRNTTTIIPSNPSLPVEELLHQQFDNRQATLNRTTYSRPWKTSNSIETLKKMIANRQRLAANSRTLNTSSNPTSMFELIPSST